MNQLGFQLIPITMLIARFLGPREGGDPGKKSSECLVLRGGDCFLWEGLQEGVVDQWLWPLVKGRGGASGGGFSSGVSLGGMGGSLLDTGLRDVGREGWLPSRCLGRRRPPIRVRGSSGAGLGGMGVCSLTLD